MPNSEKNESGAMPVKRGQPQRLAANVGREHSTLDLEGQTGRVPCEVSKRAENSRGAPRRAPLLGIGQLGTGFLVTPMSPVSTMATVAEAAAAPATEAGAAAATAT
jgi:hypothetical protein